MKNYFLLKNQLLLVVFLFFTPIHIFASTDIISCSKNGFTILTINGVLSSENDAKNNKEGLKRYLPEQYNGQKIVVNYLHNPSHLGGLSDIFDVIKQGLFDQKSDYDLVEMVRDASQKIQTQKVLLVAHSQGNFYANNFYEKVGGNVGGIPLVSLGVYGVASPAKSVAGGGLYITSDTDTVIANVAEKTLGGVLRPNVHIPRDDSKDPLGHSFSDIYIEYEGGRIVREIQTSLSKLSSNTIQKENAPCIDPPVISQGHKIVGAMFSVADPVARVTKSVIAKTYTQTSTLMNAGAKVIAWLYSKSVSLARSFGSLSLASAIPPESLITGAIIEDGAVPPDTIVAPEVLPPDEVVVFDGDVVPLPIDIPPQIEEPSTTEVSSGGSSTNRESSGGGRAPSLPSDTVSPVITLNGDERIDIISGVIYEESGATAFDEIDGVRDVVVSGGVDTDTLGVHTVTYTAQDTSGNVSTRTRTVTVIGGGTQINFNLEHKISYQGDFVRCDATTGVGYPGNNMSVTTHISSTSWATPYQHTVNTGMPIGVPMYFIFGHYTTALVDCREGTHRHPYSNRFSYTTESGDSVVYDARSQNLITGFRFESASPLGFGAINQTPYTVAVVVPHGTDLTALTPTIEVSSGATITPTGGVARDFTGPVSYTVTSEDGTSQMYTINVVHSTGIMSTFSDLHRITYTGRFALCNMDTRTLVGTMDNIGIGTFVSSTNWATSYQHNENTNMIPRANMRFIFGPHAQSQSDCANNTYVSNYSNSFYYTTAYGLSIIYGTYTPPVQSSEKKILSFEIRDATDDISISLDESLYAGTISVPFEVDVTTLVPEITVSDHATISPASGIVTDFSSPISYTVTAENGTTAVYLVTVAIRPEVVLPPTLDTTPPFIENYTVDGSEDVRTVDPVSNPVTLVFTANESVDWVSIKIEKSDDPLVYKMFYSGGTCVDGELVCTKVWRDTSKGLLSSGEYRIKMYMKDTAGNIYREYLSPSKLIVDTP